MSFTGFLTEPLITYYVEIAAVLLFSVGFSTLLFHQNLIKKIIALSIMDSAIFLFLAAKGYIAGRMPPILERGLVDPALYVHPLPSALVLTGIVISVSLTAFFLALTLRLYEKFGTLQLDEIIHMTKEERE